MQKMNLTMLVDFYELTMGNGYFKNGFKDKIAYFDMFFRKIPDDGGFAIMAGVEQLIEYIKEIKFYDEDIEYLRSKKIFDNDFLEYLKNFKFSCDIWAVPEGTPIFPNEPIITVRGPIIEAQLIETMVLLVINHQSLIATKANRIVRAAKGRPVMEFGSRRAQGSDGAVLGARAAYIGGCVATACTLADREYKIPATGTMAHSWIQMFETELEAFRTFARIYPEDCVLLVDTYNVLKSGVPNAIKVFKEEVIAKGFKPKGIRIDSGDVTYLTKASRKMLNEAGLEDCKIVVSNSLDEYIIRDILEQGAMIDSFGVGERLITSKSEPVFGGVYKLVAIEKSGKIEPRIKVSENVEKITNPDFKEVWRLYSKYTGKAIADVLTTRDEVISEDEPYEIFDPKHTWKRQRLKNFRARKLLVPLFKGGECVYETPELFQIREYTINEVNTLWEEVLRFEKPQEYYIDLSEKLLNIKNDLLKKYVFKNEL